MIFCNDFNERFLKLVLYIIKIVISHRIMNRLKKHTCDNITCVVHMWHIVRWLVKIYN